MMQRARRWTKLAPSLRLYARDLGLLEGQVGTHGRLKRRGGHSQHGPGCLNVLLRYSRGPLKLAGTKLPMREPPTSLWSYFVVGAPAYLKTNVAPHKRLANGSPQYDLFADGPPRPSPSGTACRRPAAARAAPAAAALRRAMLPCGCSTPESSSAGR